MAIKKTIVIVGGTFGGSALAAAKARQSNEHARIILLEQAPKCSWSISSLSGHLTCDEKACLLKRIEQEKIFSKRFNIELMSTVHALGLDVDAHCLLLENSGSIERLRYDTLIAALGIESRMLEVAHLGGPRVMGFKDHDDITAIKNAIKCGARRAVVVGCGSYGLDAAFSLKRLGLSVDIIDAKKRIMPEFSLQFASTMLLKLREEGIAVTLNTMVLQALVQSDDSFRLLLSNEEEVYADIVVICIGITPKTALLVNAGAAMDIDGLIRVDDHMRTTLPHVFACGAAISVPLAVNGDRVWMPKPAVIERTAHIAGFNAAIDDITEKDAIKPISGTYTVAVGDMFFSRTGLNEQQARALVGDDTILITTVFSSPADALGLQHEMCVKLILDRLKHRIIGAEVFGGSYILRSVDLLAVSITRGFSPAELIDLDLAYHGDIASGLDTLKDAATRAYMGLLEKNQFISVETLALWLKNERDVRLVDVGETPKLSGRIATKTLHLPLETIREHIGELPLADVPIVLYSKSGYRSYLAQQALRQRGLNNVYHLDGGLATWDLIIAKE